MAEEEREKRGIGNLPGSLEEAISLTEKGTIVKETLGEHLHESFIDNEKKELNEFEESKYIHSEDKNQDNKNITKYELENLLPVL